MDTGGFVGAHRPIHAFYITQPLVIATPVQTSTIKPHHSINSKKTVSHAHPTSLATAHPISRSSHALSSSTPLLPIISMSPPLIRKQGEPTILNTAHQQVHANQPRKDQAWLAPLLGLLGLLGIVGIALLFFLCKRRRQRHRNNQISSEKRIPPSHESWASISTIQTSMLDGDKAKPPPPAYNYQKAQKRLTADTLVEEPSVLMLKNQYSPQLAFSPSLVAGEFQLQQQEEKPPMPTISPSNTLIDNAGILNEEKGTRPRIEIYDPQVNLQHDGPFDNPYSYTNDEEKNKWFGYYKYLQISTFFFTR